MTACGNAGLREMLWKGCLSGAFGYPNSSRDLFMRQPLEDGGEALPLSIGELACCRSLICTPATHRFLQQFTVKPDLSRQYVADSFNQERSRAMFHKDSRDATAYELGSLLLLHPGGNHQNFPSKSFPPRPEHEFSPVVLTEVVVQQHNLNWRFS